MKLKLYTSGSIGLFVIALLCSILNTPSAARGASSDFYIQQALDRLFAVPQDARTLAQGGSRAANCANSSCLFSNPAGLGFLSKTEVSGQLGSVVARGEEFEFEHEFEQDELNGWLLMSVPLGYQNDVRPAYGTLTMGYTRYHADGDDTLNTSPDGHIRSIGYGIAPLESFSLGYSLVFFDDQLHNEVLDYHSHTRFLHIIGFQLKPAEDLTIGTAFQMGVGQSDIIDIPLQSKGLSHVYRYTSTTSITKVFSAVEVSAGFDYSAFRSKSNFTEVSPENVTGGSEQGEQYNTRLGVEVHISPELSFGAGARWLLIPEYEFERAELANLSGSINTFGWSGGLGYHFGDNSHFWRGLRVDYGVEYLNINDREWQQLVTISLPLFPDPPSA